MKRRLRLIIGIVVSLVALWAVLRNIDPRELWLSYRDADYLYIAPALLLLFSINWVRAYRWRLLIYPNHDLPLGRLFSIVNIGYLFNNILPAKVGELARAYMVGRMIPGGVARALSSLLIERLLDVLVLVVLVFGLMPFIDMPPFLINAGRLLGLLSVCGVAVLVVLTRIGDRGLDWVLRFLRRVPWIGHPKVRAALENLLAGFRVLTVGKLLPATVLSSLVIWFGYALLNYIALAVFGMTHLPVTAAAFVLCATGFSMVVPSSPGGMGVWEAAVVLALSVYGVEQTQAFGYAFGLHALTNVALIVLGLWGLRSESLTFADVRVQVTDGDPGQEAGLAES